MRPLNWRTLAATGVAGALLAWLGAFASMESGATPVRVPWTTLLVGVLLGGATLWAGWTVRQYKAGKRPGLEGVRAARIAVATQACAYAGVLLLGAYGAYALVLARDWGHLPRREAAIAAGLAALGGLVMGVAGVIAERWCRIGPDDDDDDDPEPTVAH